MHNGKAERQHKIYGNLSQNGMIYHPLRCTDFTQDVVVRFAVIRITQLLKCQNSCTGDKEYNAQIQADVNKEHTGAERAFPDLIPCDSGIPVILHSCLPGIIRDIFFNPCLICGNLRLPGKIDIPVGPDGCFGLYNRIRYNDCQHDFRHGTGAEKAGGFPGVYQLELVTIYGYRLMRITDGCESIQNIFLCADEECFFVMNGYGLISL